MAQPLVIYTPEARADLLALESYVAVHDGEARAELVIGRIEETIRTLAYMPRMGRARPYLAYGTLAFAVHRRRPRS